MRRGVHVALTFILILAVFMAACGGGGQRTDAPGSDQGGRGTVEGPELVYALNAEPVKLDPQDVIDQPSFDAIRHIYDRLVEHNAEGEIVPSLAKSWVVSEDGRTWTFHLRDDVSFHDGTPFNAEAVKFMVDRVLASDPGLAGRGRWEPYIESVEVIDEHTVQFRTFEPWSGLLPLLASGYAAIPSPTAVQERGSDFARNPVGTGPFSFVSWTSGQEITLKRNESYWAGAPSIGTVTLRVIPDDAARVLALRSGDVHMIPRVPAQSVSTLEQSGIDIIVADTFRTFYWAFNTTKPYFQDPRVRQAFNYAIDRRSIVENVLLGYGRPADSPLAPPVQGYVSADFYNYDPQKARDLLEAAGWDFGRTLVAYVTEGRYYMDRQVAEAIQGMLADVGVNVDVQVLEWGAFVDAIWSATADDPVARARDFMQTAWGAPDPGFAMRAVLHGDSWPTTLYNEAFYANDRVDQLIEAVENTVEPAEQVAHLAELQRLLVEEAPWIFVYFEQQVLGKSNRLDGVVVLPTEEVLLHEARIAP